VNGRAFPAVWRETLAFTAGGLRASTVQFPRIRPGAPWDHRPEPDSDADVEQAIAAKLHLSLRMLPLLAQARVVLVEPVLAQLVPDWTSNDEEAVYAAEAKLPTSPLFLDLESEIGLPAAWEAETWPLPFHLRAALAWVRDEMLCLIPFGSVGGVHPWGGNDYQAWARWVFLQGHLTDWPNPGPGDFIARANGDLLAWIDCEQESICAHQGAVAHNLVRRVLSVLIAIEAVGGELVAPVLPRPVRRRGAREGHEIALVPARFPQPRALVTPAEAPDPDLGGRGCVVPKTHARLEQAHVLWHEALAAYDDPDLFVTKLNALIQALRTVTWVLRKEFGNSEDFKRWYARWETLMGADSRLNWALSARNAIEKQGDLDTHSVAHVRVRAGWLASAVLEIEVDPTADAREIARRLTLVGLPALARRDGTLEVERRWTVPELADDELLDALAHCYGVLARIVADAHAQRHEAVEHCVLSVESRRDSPSQTPHPSGRLPCMIASREARTSRRDLSTGAPYGVEVRSVTREPVDSEAVRQRYAMEDWRAPTQEAPFVDGAAALHELGKRMFAADGYHITIAWLLRDGQSVTAPMVLHPEDQRDKYMMMERLALDADLAGASALIFSTEIWEAPAVAADDPRAELRPSEREDRTEAFVTYAIERGQPCHIWSTRFNRVDGEIEFERTRQETADQPLFLEPLMRVWSAWPDP
jgi:hypothetical protein